MSLFDVPPKFKKGQTVELIGGKYRAEHGSTGKVESISQSMYLVSFFGGDSLWIGEKDLQDASK